jgi:hypothetical protein
MSLHHVLQASILDRIGLRFFDALCRHLAEGESYDFGIEIGVQIGHLSPPHTHHVDTVVDVGCATGERGGVSPFDDDRRIPRWAADSNMFDVER